MTADRHFDDTDDAGYYQAPGSGEDRMWAAFSTRARRIGYPDHRRDVADDYDGPDAEYPDDCPGRAL
jgi:hypothetical protein